MPRLILVLLCLLVATAHAQDADIAGIWQLSSPPLQQQLELKRDGTYQRRIVTATSERIEVGRWHSDVSVLVIAPDHVITAQGARVPLPPREKMIDVAGVDGATLTLYYDGDALETWQRAPAIKPNTRTAPVVAASALPPATASELQPAVEHAPRKRVRQPELRVPQPSLAAPKIESPELPTFRLERKLALPAIVFAVPATTRVDTPPLPEFTIAPALEAPVLARANAQPDSGQGARAASSTHDTALPAPPIRTPQGLYAEAQVVELITQIACEQLRYPQHAGNGDALHYQQMARDIGMVPLDAARLSRTLRFYQSNAAFLRKYQSSIAQSSMRCALAHEQVTAVSP